MNRGKGEDTKRRGEETRELKISNARKQREERKQGEEEEYGKETRRGKEKKGGRGRTFILTSQLL